MRFKGISQLIALLILLVLLVGTVIAVNFIIFGFMNKQKPNLADVSLTLSGARLEGTTLYIHGAVVAVGKGRIRITRIEIYKGDQLIQFTSSKTYIPSALKPGETYEIVINLYGVSGIARGDRITVVIYWNGLQRGGVSKAMTIVS